MSEACECLWFRRQNKGRFCKRTLWITAKILTKFVWSIGRNDSGRSRRRNARDAEIWRKKLKAPPRGLFFYVCFRPVSKIVSFYFRFKLAAVFFIFLAVASTALSTASLAALSNFLEPLSIKSLAFLETKFFTAPATPPPAIFSAL